MNICWKREIKLGMGTKVYKSVLKCTKNKNKNGTLGLLLKTDLDLFTWTNEEVMP